MGPKNSGHPKDREQRFAEADAKLKAAQQSQEESFTEDVSDLLMELGVDLNKIDRDDSGNFTEKGIETIRKHIRAHIEKRPFVSAILEELLHIRDKKAD